MEAGQGSTDGTGPSTTKGRRGARQEGSMRSESSRQTAVTWGGGAATCMCSRQQLDAAIICAAPGAPTNKHNRWLEGMSACAPM